MKTSLRVAGISVPCWETFNRVPSSTNTPSLPAGMAFPVVVKPRQESNSRGVRVIHDSEQWHRWLEQRAGEQGWEIEQHIDAPMYFMDGVVFDGRYTPLVLGEYLGPLLPRPGVQFIGVTSVPRTSSLWDQAADLGACVAAALGTDGRFVTHLEFLRTQSGLTVMEASARAPGALVSEMGRVIVGHNLEQVQLRLGAGEPLPDFIETGEHAAWVSILAGNEQQFLHPPTCASTTDIRHLPAPPAITGRHVAVMALLSHRDRAALTTDVQRCSTHQWFADDASDESGGLTARANR